MTEKLEELPGVVWKKARNYRSVQPDRCCATCAYIVWDWDCVQVCTQDEERWDVDTITVCDKWKKKE